MFRNFGGQLSHSMICHIPSLLSFDYFSQNNKCLIQAPVLLLTLLENKHHVCCVPVSSEAAVALWKMFFLITNSVKQGCLLALFTIFPSMMLKQATIIVMEFTSDIFLIATCLTSDYWPTQRPRRNWSDLSLFNYSALVIHTFWTRTKNADALPIKPTFQQMAYSLLTHVTQCATITNHPLKNDLHPLTYWPVSGRRPIFFLIYQLLFIQNKQN